MALLFFFLFIFLVENLFVYIVHPSIFYPLKNMTLSNPKIKIKIKIKIIELSSKNQSPISIYPDGDTAG